MVVVAEPPEVVKRNHLVVGAGQCSRQFLSHSLQNAQTRLLLNPSGKCDLSALLPLLR
jgi:hypothetical protein